jgi:hypothetical protein
MISLLPLPGRSRRLSRRDLIRLSAVGGAGLALPQMLRADALQTTHRPTAKQCIFIFLCGGPSHIDMWDLKPDAPDTIRGPFQPIATSAPGIQIGELLPQLSKQADKFSIIRSMTHDSNVHGVGIKYMLLADTLAPSKQTFPPTRSDHPGMGAILQSLLGNSSQLPCWVTLPRPFTTGNRVFKGQSGGFLGPGYDPFFLNVEQRDSLAEKSFQVDGLRLPEGVDAGRLDSRQQLLRRLNAPADELLQSTATRNLGQQYHKAFTLLSSDGAGRVFDLDREPQSLKDRYGRHEYGQSFLLARRLVESGVRMVNVFWTYYGKDGCQFNLWDNHGSDKPVCGGYNKGVDMIRGDYCCPAFDRAFSALLEDLSDRGLLDETLVVVTGEFGRTPKINKTAGRDHWGSCYSTVLAGGGVQGGQVFGASDPQGAYVKDSPVKPQDLGATMLHAFGFPPEAEVYAPTGRPVRSSRGMPLTSLF